MSANDEAGFVAERAITFRVAMELAHDMKCEYTPTDILNIAIFLAGDNLEPQDFSPEDVSDSPEGDNAADSNGEA